MAILPEYQSVFTAQCTVCHEIFHHAKDYANHIGKHITEDVA